MSEIASFSIQNPKEIIRHLALLLKKKCFIDARFGDSKDSYITTLLAINEADNTLVLDCSPKDEINQRMLTSSKITFDTEYTGIKVSFAGAKLKKILHKGDPAFIMPVPKSLYWMQRREYYRVKSPLSKPSYCQLILEGRAPVNLTLYDISLTGFSMLNVSKELSDLLMPGSSIISSNLLLSGIGESPISFEICNKYIINPEKLQKIQKIGCKFIRLSRPAEELVQRYMQQVQRDNLQKE
ncbi:MAG: flagellar brake protein [Methylobacter sp.]|nr:flagellar brake protein [Methylobacter sp.]